MAEEEFGNIIYSHSNLVILKPVATQRQGQGAAAARLQPGINLNKLQLRIDSSHLSAVAVGQEPD
jgi:hypothetical protein